MSSICLTCEGNNLTENCVFTAQGDLQCYNKGDTPEDQMNAAIQEIRTGVPSPASSPAGQVYPVRGVDSFGYYRYISDLSGEPIKMRYGQTIPADVTNACAAKISERKDSAENAIGLPEWGAHASWIQKKDAGTLKDPYMESDAATYPYSS
jgi:hypothetical protein